MSDSPIFDQTVNETEADVEPKTEEQHASEAENRDETAQDTKDETPAEPLQAEPQLEQVQPEESAPVLHQSLMSAGPVDPPFDPYAAQSVEKEPVPEGYDVNDTENAPPVDVKDNVVPDESDEVEVAKNQDDEVEDFDDEDEFYGDDEGASDGDSQ